MSTTPRWNRPVPTIGDATSAAERADAPDGWAFAPEVVEHLHTVLGARRDIRRYRPDDVPDELVRHVLEAGHAAPSVGHSQPWRFVVVRSPKTRERAAVLADRERLRQAEQLTPDRRARLLDLQLEGIREAPLGIVVACDRRAPATGVLGRATFPDADLWSCACAIENMWLTARAVGLGMGWVTLFRPADLAAMLDLPDGVETLGWLCLGWPDERPPGPGLERRAWSSKAPLDDVILAERWSESAPPASYLRAPGPDAVGPDSDGLDGAGVRAPDQAHVVGASDAADRLLTPPGSLGAFDTALNRVVAAGQGDADGGTLVLVGADHPVAEHGVSAFDPGVTGEVMRAAVAGEALGVVTARAAGLGVVVTDAGCRTPVPGARTLAPGEQGDLVHTDALTAADCARLVEAGRALGREAAASGLVVLGEVGVANTTVAAALAAALLGLDPANAVGLGASSDTAMLERKRAVVAAALARVSRRAEPLDLLAALGGPELAVLTGVVLGASSGGAVCVLDGLATSVPALVAVRVEPAVQAYLVAGQVSREGAHRAVLTDLGLEPLLDLRLRAGEGVGASLAAQTLLTGLRVRREAARTA